MLKNKVSIYVPSTYRDQAAPDNVVKFYVNNTLKELSKNVWRRNSNGRNW